MHELSIVQSLLDRVGIETEAHEAAAVRLIRVRLGEVSGVEPDLLRSAFELARVGTPCAEAELELDAVAASWLCPGCERPFGAGDVLSCPACGLPARLAGGDEIILERIELEVPDV